MSIFTVGVLLILSKILVTVADIATASFTEEKECTLMVPEHDQMLFFGRLAELRSDQTIQIIDVNLTFPQYAVFPITYDKFLYQPQVWKKVFTNNAVQMLALLHDYKVFSVDLISFTEKILPAPLIDQPAFCFGNLTAERQAGLIARLILHNFSLNSNLTYRDLTSGLNVCYQKMQEAAVQIADFVFQCCSLNWEGDINCEVARPPIYHLWIRTFLPYLSLIIVLIAPWMLSTEFVTGSYTIKEYITDMPQLMSVRFRKECPDENSEWTPLVKGGNEDKAAKTLEKRFPDANILVEQIKKTNGDIPMMGSTYVTRNKYVKITVSHHKLLTPSDASSLMYYYLLRLLNPFKKYEVEEDDGGLGRENNPDEQSVTVKLPRRKFSFKKGAFWKILFLILFEFVFCLLPFWSAVILFYVFEKNEVEQRQMLASECGLLLDKPIVCFRDPLRPFPLTAFVAGLASFFGLFVLYSTFRQDFRVFLGEIFDDFRHIKLVKLLNVALDYLLLPFQLSVPLLIAIIVAIPLWVYALILILLNCLYYCVPLIFFSIRTFTKAFKILTRERADLPGENATSAGVYQKYTDEGDRKRRLTLWETFVKAIFEIPHRERVIDKDFAKIKPSRYQFQGHECIPIWIAFFFILWMLSHFYLWSCLLTSMLEVVLIKIASLIFYVGEPLVGTDVIFYLVPIVLSRFINLGQEYGECCKKVIEVVKDKVAEDAIFGEKSRTDKFFRNDASEAVKLNRPPVAFKYFTNEDAVEMCNEDHDQECLTRAFKSTVPDKLAPAVGGVTPQNDKDALDLLVQSREKFQSRFGTKKNDSGVEWEDVASKPKQVKLATKYPLRMIYCENSTEPTMKYSVDTARLYGNMTDRLVIGPVPGSDSEKLILRSNALVLFLDDDTGSTIRISSKFFHQLCQLKAPGCPGPIFDNIVRFLKDALILLFILFGFIIVASILIKQHKVEGITSLMLTLLPFALPRILKKDTSLSSSETRQFKNLIERHLKLFNQTWEIGSIKLDFPEITEGWNGVDDGLRRDVLSTNTVVDNGKHTDTDNTKTSSVMPVYTVSDDGKTESDPLVSKGADELPVVSNKNGRYESAKTLQPLAFSQPSISVISKPAGETTVKVTWSSIGDDLKNQQQTCVTVDQAATNYSKAMPQRIYFLKKSKIPENLSCRCSRSHFCSEEHRQRSLKPDPDFLVCL